MAVMVFYSVKQPRGKQSVPADYILWWKRIKLWGSKCCFVILVFFVVACQPITYAVKQAATANDEALKSAEFIVCKGASVGSIRRVYGAKEKAIAWRALCSDNDDFNPEK